MANISLKECADGESQQWNVMADGRIALEASKPREFPRQTSIVILPQA